jgi:hypothetical protein
MTARILIKVNGLSSLVPSTVQDSLGVVAEYAGKIELDGCAHAR